MNTQLVHLDQPWAVLKCPTALEGADGAVIVATPNPAAVTCSTCRWRIAVAAVYALQKGMTLPATIVDSFGREIDEVRAQLAVGALA